jgi:hypothetical protein
MSFRKNHDFSNSWAALAQRDEGCTGAGTVALLKTWHLGVAVTVLFL